MQKNLVIVESPAKAKTIEKFLGNDYKVLSSYGHIRDLKKKEFSIDVENGFEPTYEIPADKKKLVAELKAEAKKADMVWLASDEDREGEAISWHLFEVLGLDPEKTKRIVFHEITKTAILKAIENPRDIDVNLVNAQQARRILDRIVGFELSPVLWKKVKPALSAGRVQSVAVRLIVEREREVHAFVSEPSYRVTAVFEVPDVDGNEVEVKAELSNRFKTKEEAQAFLETCKDAQFSIEDIITRPVKKSPAAPFTTSTLQQEAARKLGFTVAQTMMVAQRLYENGQITYMRTDSVNLSDLALNTSKQTILSLMGERYVKVRKFATKTKGAQEAHEAIRPTYMLEQVKENSADTSKTEAVQLKNVNINALNPEILQKFLSSGLEDEVDSFVHDYFHAIGREPMESLVFRNYVVLNVRFSVLSFLKKIGYDDTELSREETDDVVKKTSQSTEASVAYAEEVLKRAIAIRDENAGSQNRSVLKQAIDFIDGHYMDEEISLNRVAHAANVSANHFSALFSQNMGQTFIEYLTSLRMDKAKELLRCTSKRSSEIAGEVGYKDAHYFSYLFKKTQGMTPSEYRKTRGEV